MRNITVTVDDEVYTQARVWAAQHNTTVSAVVQYMLSTLRTDWRTKAFLAARAANPSLRKPVASPLPSHPPAPNPTPTPLPPSRNVE